MGHIWRFHLVPGVSDIMMPQGASVLKAEVMRSKIVLVAVASYAPVEYRRFAAIDATVPSPTNVIRYFGSVFVDGSQPEYNVYELSK